MQIVNIDEKIIYGFKTRTNNQNKMNPKTVKIAKIWQKFDNEVEVNYQNGERVYGVYYDYEADFSVLEGYEKKSDLLEKVVIQKG